MKKFLMTFLLLMLSVIGYFAYYNWTGIRNILFEKNGLFPSSEQLEIITNKALAEQLSQEQRRHLSFAGQHLPVSDVQWDTTNSAWLVKGKLLDQHYADVFAHIKDTISLQFGDQFYFVPQTEAPYRPDARFVFARQTEANDVALEGTADGSNLEKIYAKLVYEGKAEGYRIVPQKFYSPKYLYATVDFQRKYQGYFSRSAILEAADREVKEVLLNDFFNTEEGKNFGYANFKGDYRNYSVVRDFTQSGKDELAIVLTDLQEAEMGRHKEALIVVAYDPNKQQYYMLYKKMFYDKIKIGEYFYSAEKDLYQEFAGSETRLTFCILLKVPDQPDRILRYDKAFDQIIEVPMR